MNREGFLKSAAMLLAAASLPIAAQAKPKTTPLQDYDLVHAGQFYVLQCYALAWAYESEPGKFRVAKDRDGLSGSYHTEAEFLDKYLRPDRKALYTYYRRRDKQFPGCSGKHIFVVPNTLKLPDLHRQLDIDNFYAVRYHVKRVG